MTEEPEIKFCSKCGKPYMRYKGININMSCNHIHSFVKYLEGRRVVKNDD